MGGHFAKEGDGRKPVQKGSLARVRRVLCLSTATKRAVLVHCCCVLLRWATLLDNHRGTSKSEAVDLLCHTRISVPNKCSVIRRPWGIHHFSKTSLFATVIRSPFAANPPMDSSHNASLQLRSPSPSLQRHLSFHVSFTVTVLDLSKQLPVQLFRQCQHPRADRRTIPSVLPFSSMLCDTLHKVPESPVGFDLSCCRVSLWQPIWSQPHCWPVLSSCSL